MDTQMNTEQPIYCGSGKSTQYDGIMLTICLDDIPEKHIFVNSQNKRSVRLLCGKRKETGQFGHTHYLKVVTQDPNWKPLQKNFTEEKLAGEEHHEPPF